MSDDPPSPTPRKTPAAGAVLAAARNPGGWVYEVGGGFGAGGATPPEAVIGAWKVGDDGKIVGEFQPNPNYDPKKWPPPQSLNQSSLGKPPPLVIKR